MVRKRTTDGRGWYHEPPYTEAEELALYRCDGPFTVLRGSVPPVATPPAEVPQPPRKSPQRPPEE